jgi:hypothetical protein
MNKMETKNNSIRLATIGQLKTFWRLTIAKTNSAPSMEVYNTFRALDANAADMALKDAFGLKPTPTNK